jgi:hypothetical protein
MNGRPGPFGSRASRAGTAACGVIIWGASFRPGDIRRRIDRLALHPSVTQISDKAQRGDFVNAAWRRYGIVNSVSLAAVLAGWDRRGIVNSVSLAAVLAGWIGARANEAAPSRLSVAERPLALAKDALVGLVAVTGVATALQGIRFARQPPGGAVPLDDGDHAAPEASETQRRAKRRLHPLGLTSLAAELGLVRRQRRAPRSRASAGRRAAA